MEEFREGEKITLYFRVKEDGVGSIKAKKLTIVKLRKAYMQTVDEKGITECFGYVEAKKRMDYKLITGNYEKALYL